MTDPRPATVADHLTRIEGKIDRLLAMAANARPSGGAPAAAGDITPAADAQLDDPQWGDPQVKNPKRWTGPSFTGRRMSQCSPEFLDCLADQNVWRAGKAIEDGKDPKWARLDAARAMGWAARIRAGWVAPVDADFGSDAADPEGEIPF